MITEKIGGGTEVGSFTNVNANLTLQNAYSYVKKTGNVVFFKAQCSINTTFTPGSTTSSMMKVPWKPAGWENCIRYINDGSNGDSTTSVGFINSSGEVCIGAKPWTGLTQGRQLVFSGSFISS